MCHRPILPLSHLLDFSRAAIEHGEYDDYLDVKEGVVATEWQYRILYKS